MAKESSLEGTSCPAKGPKAPRQTLMSSTRDLFGDLAMAEKAKNPQAKHLALGKGMRYV